MNSNALCKVCCEQRWCYSHYAVSSNIYFCCVWIKLREYVCKCVRRLLFEKYLLTTTKRWFCNILWQIITGMWYNCWLRIRAKFPKQCQSKIKNMAASSAIIRLQRISFLAKKMTKWRKTLLWWKCWFLTKFNKTSSFNCKTVAFLLFGCESAQTFTTAPENVK